ncbi:unnamed protein product [Cylindrotheca closterium]|uniref:O-fucosyltransferase family protein n=1 Tax=Cylindrotheca closterium TaxID=2856 RepID=A0AAD2FJX1_9STRA|nr:unnamed protein product [Cylindrotheca closterium]
MPIKLASKKKSSSSSPFSTKYIILLLIGAITAVVFFNVGYVSKIVPDDLIMVNPMNKKSFQDGTKFLNSAPRPTDPPRQHAPDDHQVAGLNCDRFGGPSPEIAKEMVYWRDIPADAKFVSPFAGHGPERKYLTFEPDEGGWNNIRMGLETVVALAHAMGRTLVLPPEQGIYLMRKEDSKKKNRFTFRDFFHFESIEKEHPGVKIISMEEFLEQEVKTGQFKDEYGQPMYPPDTVDTSTLDGHPRNGREFWHWLRKASKAPVWNFDECVVGIPAQPGPGTEKRLHDTFEEAVIRKFRNPAKYRDNPTQVNSIPALRLAEMLAYRTGVCQYSNKFQNAKVMHFMGDNASGARLLVHFYAFLFFEDWKQDLIAKRFIRDHLRYIDEIQCGAARVVNALRKISRDNGDPNGEYNSFHIRRGDFQYKDTRVEAEVIYKNMRNELVENSTVFIATDERDKSFFDPLKEHYHLYFLDDFNDELLEVNKNYVGMLDQLVASRGRVFSGAFYSTFTNYINRVRGYHSQKNKLPGYEMGAIDSYYYIPKGTKTFMKHYHSIQSPIWAQEFPIGWRDIDHDVDEASIIS